MPASLLDSQLALLEQPAPDERALVLAGTAGAEAETAAVLTWITGAAAG